MNYVLIIPICIALSATTPLARGAETSPRDMNVLIRSIHSEFLKLKKTTPWFSKYTDNALAESDGHAMIIYDPPEKPTPGPQPQQSDHVTISSIAIDAGPSGNKYLNVFEYV